VGQKINPVEILTRNSATTQRQRSYTWVVSLFILLMASKRLTTCNSLEERESLKKRLIKTWFLLRARDATHSAVMLQYVVCPSVTFKYRDHIGWNTSKIISRPISLRCMLGLTPTWAIWSNGNTANVGVEWSVSVWNNSMRVAYLTELMCIEA